MMLDNFTTATTLSGICTQNFGSGAIPALAIYYERRIGSIGPEPQ